jgi:homocysteine S-methyltransferase
MPSTTLSDPIAAILAARPLMILDGALATELERRGANLNDPLWSAKVLLEQPELIRQVHYDYFAAGADVATTASYQATFEAFAKRGIGADAAAGLMRTSVELACQARDAFWAEPANRVGRPRPLVAASVGPYGAMLADGSEYKGQYGLSVEQLMAFHRPRLHVLAKAGADLLACETIPCLAEALALARLLPELPGVSAWISFSCQDGEHNSEGEPLADCVAQLDGYAQVAAVGVNCSAPEHMSALIGRMRARTSKPLLVYPNSGEQYDGADKQWRGCAHTQPFAEQARDWHRQGARLIGGCCRTNPEDIRALADWARAGEAAA